MNTVWELWLFIKKPKIGSQFNISSVFPTGIENVFFFFLPVKTFKKII